MPEAEAEAEAAAPVQPQTGAAPPNVDLDQYVWTGTDYVRLDELDEADRQALEGERAAGERGGDADIATPTDDANTHE